MNLTNDPDPVRFDGNGPRFKSQEIKLASIGTLTGILSQSIIGNTSSPKLYYYLNDHLGTPQVITDEDGEVVWMADYRPFGEATVYPAFMVNSNFRLPGQYYDEETGVHYNYHRYYGPRTGRYLTPDPIGIIKGMNHLYDYAENNPIVRIDPKGEYAVFFIRAGIIAVTTYYVGKLVYDYCQCVRWAGKTVQKIDQIKKKIYVKEFDYVDPKEVFNRIKDTKEWRNVLKYCGRAAIESYTTP